MTTAGEHSLLSLQQWRIDVAAEPLLVDLFQLSVGSQLFQAGIDLFTHRDIALTHPHCEFFLGEAPDRYSVIFGVSLVLDVVIGIGAINQ